MTNKKRALGRGLSALLSEKSSTINTAQDKNADQIVGNIIDIPIDRIQTNPYQPRTQFEQEALQELSSSIKELGVIQPITVRKNGTAFQLISGERRFRASKIAGLTQIPAYVRLANDREMLEMALVENIQRQELDPIEVSLSFQQMINELGLTQDEMSNRVGKKRSTITNYLRLLKLDPIIQTAIRDRVISMGHGKTLINIENIQDQLAIYHYITKNNLSVRQTEDYVKNYKQETLTKTTNSTKLELPHFYRKTLNDWQNQWQTTVEINRSSKGKGKIIISFKNDEDFERIKSLIQ